LRQMRELTALRAPLAGQVVARAFDPGAQVPPGSPIITLISSERDVRFAVPPARAAALAPGAEVAVRLGDAAWTASVTAVAPGVDTASQHVFAEASFAPDVNAAIPAVGTRVDVTPAPSD